MEGYLWKRPDKGLVKKWKKRWCVLEQGIVRYYKNQGDSKPAGVIELMKVCVSFLPSLFLSLYLCFLRMLLSVKRQKRRKGKEITIS